MQPEPIETSTHVIIPEDASEASNASQYGIHPEEMHFAGVPDPLHEVGFSANSTPSDATDNRSTGDVQRLSIGSRNHTRPKPSFQRIFEYENALAPSTPRQQSEGPAFKVIQKKGDRLDGPQLDAFPNGMRHLWHVMNSIC